MAIEEVWDSPLLLGGCRGLGTSDAEPRCHPQESETGR